MSGELSANDVLKLIVEIAERVQYRDIYNERYIHHFFTQLLHERYGLLCNILGDKAINLHPEWPTYKESTGIEYGQYKTMEETRNGKKGKILKPSENSRSGGYIDFAVGRYEQPAIGIEFTMSNNSWPGNSVEGDIVKLLDSKNPFQTSISLNLVFREKGLSKGGRSIDFEDAMNKRLETAVERLRSYSRLCGDLQRQIYLIVLMASLKRPIMAAEKRPEVARRIPHLDDLNPASFPHLQSTLFSSLEVCNCLLEY